MLLTKVLFLSFCLLLSRIIIINNIKLKKERLRESKDTNLMWFDNLLYPKRDCCISLFMI